MVFCTKNIFFSLIMSFLFTTTTLNFLLQTSSEGESPALIVLKIYALPSFSHIHSHSFYMPKQMYVKTLDTYIYRFSKICKLMNACIERMVVLALEEYWRDFHQSLLAKKKNQVFHTIFNVMKTALSVCIAWLSIQDDSWYRW